jgi:hypothetical protein
MLRKESEALQ